MSLNLISQYFFLLFHRLALCTSQAATGVYDNIQSTVCSTYAFFSNSAARTKRLHDIENLLDDTPVLKLVEPSTVRWLSLDHAVRTMFRVWNAVVIALQYEATCGAENGKAKAQGILKKVIFYTFPFYLFKFFTTNYTKF